MYQFDLYKWIVWLLPMVIRQQRMAAWLFALGKPIQTIHGRFLNFIFEKNEEILTTPQVCKLRGLLNNKLDNTQRRIYILDFQQAGQTFIFLESEQRPLFLPDFLSSGERFDFIVRVPSEYQNQNGFITALLNKYKLPSKKFLLQYE